MWKLLWKLQGAPFIHFNLRHNGLFALVITSCDAAVQNADGGQRVIF